MEWDLLGDNKTLEEVGDIIAEDFKGEFDKKKEISDDIEDRVVVALKKESE